MPNLKAVILSSEKKKADKSIRRSRSLEACFEKRKPIKEKKQKKIKKEKLHHSP